MANAYFRWYLVSNVDYKRSESGRPLDRATSLGAALGRASEILTGMSEYKVNFKGFKKLDLVDVDTGQITTLYREDYK